MILKNKLIIYSVFNILLWFAFKFQNNLQLDMILDPEGPSRLAPLILLYLVFVVPVLTLGILIYFMYKLLKKRFKKEYIGAALINATLLLIISLTMWKYI